MPFEPRLFAECPGDAPAKAPSGAEPNAMRFSETDGWPPLSAVLAEQLLSDAQRLESAYPPPNCIGFAAKLQARNDAANLDTLKGEPVELAAQHMLPSADDSVLSEGDWSRYPVPNPQSRETRVSWRQIAAAVAILLPTLALLSWRGGEPDPVVVQHPVKAVNDAATQPTSMLLPAPKSLPPLLFKSLSGPQQEAILDLLEEQDMAAESLSI